jgi:hypothetical protein
MVGATRTTPASAVQRSNSRFVLSMVIGAVVTVLGLAWLGSGLGESGGAGSGASGVTCAPWFDTRNGGLGGVVSWRRVVTG